MARRPDWLFDYPLPTRAAAAPLNDKLFGRRVDTVLFWDDVSRARVPAGARYETRDGGPVAVLADGSVVPLAGSWEPGWSQEVREMDFLGAVPLAWPRAVVWVFARPRAARPSS